MQAILEGSRRPAAASVCNENYEVSYISSICWRWFYTRCRWQGSGCDAAPMRLWNFVSHSRSLRCKLGTHDSLINSKWVDRERSRCSGVSKHRGWQYVILDHRTLHCGSLHAECARNMKISPLPILSPGLDSHEDVLARQGIPGCSSLCSVGCSRCRGHGRKCAPSLSVVDGSAVSLRPS
jgi:hypothetical protein